MTQDNERTDPPSQPEPAGDPMNAEEARQGMIVFDSKRKVLVYVASTVAVLIFAISIILYNISNY